MTLNASERIAKRLARTGLCSRREGERWICQGRVTLDGKLITTPATNVVSDSIIEVDGKIIPALPDIRLWRYHKPCGLLTTHSDPQGRPTIFDSLPADLPKVISVGRLDINSEGLMLLTNSGDLARHLELPGTRLVRRYRVRVRGIPDTEKLHLLEKGTTIDKVHYGPILATLDRQLHRNAWLSLSLREGKNREIRKILNYLGMEISRLIRISYGPFQLNKLDQNTVSEVSRHRIKRYINRL